MFKYAVKNAFRRKSTAILSILGIAIGVSLMTTMSALGATISQQANQFASSNVDMMTIQQQGQASYQSTLNLSDLINITSLEHIEAYAPEVITTISIGGGGFGDFIPTSLIGVDIGNNTAIGGDTTKLVEGILYQNDNECIISLNLAESNSLELNDVISLLTPSYDYVNITIVGFYEPELSFGFNSVYTTPNTVRYFKTGFTNDTYSIVELKIDDVNNIQTVREQIEIIIEQENLLLDLTVLEDQLQLVTQFTGTMNILVLAISLIAGLAGGMAIIVAMLMSVLERMKEFATVKATGWQNKHVIKDIIYESLIVTIIGGLIGYSLGFLFLRGISGFGSISITPLNISTVTLILVYVVALGIIGGLYPAYKASKVSPVEILRGE